MRQGFEINSFTQDDNGVTADWHEVEVEGVIAKVKPGARLGDNANAFGARTLR